MIGLRMLCLSAVIPFLQTQCVMFGVIMYSSTALSISI
jgi:hypothetical protein